MSYSIEPKVIIDTIEINGEFHIEKRSHHDRRQVQNKHWQKYDRRQQNRRYSHGSKIDISV